MMENYKREDIIYILSLLKLGEISLDKIYFNDFNDHVRKVKGHDFKFEDLITTKFYILYKEEE